MPTITEDYCSQEVYRLLREKGFDEEVHTTFDKEGYTQPSITLQMAMKWLRIEHNIHIELNWDKGNQLYSFQIWKPGKYQPEISSLDLWRIYKDYNYPGEWKYEQACEVAIKYCLENLI